MEFCICSTLTSSKVLESFTLGWFATRVIQGHFSEWISKSTKDKWAKVILLNVTCKWYSNLHNCNCEKKSWAKDSLVAFSLMIFNFALVTKTNNQGLQQWLRFLRSSKNRNYYIENKNNKVDKIFSSKNILITKFIFWFHKFPSITIKNIDLTLIWWTFKVLLDLN